MKAKPRILMIAPLFVPLGNPEAITNASLALAFLSKGYQIDIISRQFSGEAEYDYGSEWSEVWRPLKEHTYEIGYPRGNKLTRSIEIIIGAWTFKCPIDGCRWALHAYRKALELDSVNHYDVVISRSLPDAAHLPALAISKKNAIPWIANCNDPHCAKLPHPYGGGPSASIGFWYEKLLREMVDNTASITFPSTRLYKYMRQYLGENINHKSCVIPHVSRIAAEPPLCLTGGKKFVLGYAGSIFPERSPISFLEGLKSFLDRRNASDMVEFLFIGNDSTCLINKASKNELRGVIRDVGSLTFENCQKRLETCDALLIIEGDMDEGMFLPSKFIEYAQLRKPILAVTPAGSEVDQYLTNYGGGISASCKSSDLISVAIDELFEAWSSGIINEKFNALPLLEIFSPNTVVSQYEALFQEINVFRNKSAACLGAQADKNEGV